MPTPADVVRRVHEARLAGRISEVKRHLHPGQSSVVASLLHAVDRVVYANSVLQAAVTKTIGPASARAFDRSGVENAIDVFSKDVEVLSERIDGDTATVTIQVARRVPLSEVHLVRWNGRWVIRTDQPIEGLVPELLELAKVMVRLSEQLDKKPMTVDQLRRELEAQQAPIMRKIAAMTRASGT